MFREFFKSFIFYGLPFGVTFLDCIGCFATVDEVSMQPALNPNWATNANRDRVFLNPWQSRSYKYERGDVVTLIPPKYPKERYIKRIIALEGDLVKTVGYKDEYITIPEGHCWVEGDNTKHSIDSNLFGPLAVGLILARASHIIWPPARWQRLESRLPSNRIPLNLR